MRVNLRLGLELKRASWGTKKMNGRLDLAFGVQNRGKAHDMKNNTDCVKICSIISARLRCMNGPIEVQKANSHEIKVLRGPE